MLYGSNLIVISTQQYNCHVANSYIVE